ncbi:MAG TPA: hypothetical protein VF862_03505 [Gemmatimonadales bacterium]
MIVTPLPGRPIRAIRDALLSHGWEGALAVETAGGLEACAFHLTGMGPDELEALLQVAPRFGLELLTGEDWAILAGGRSRFSALARSWSLPEPLRPLAVPIGLGLPADAATVWMTGDGPVEVGDEPVFLEPAGPGTRFIECRLGQDDLSSLALRAEAGGLGLVLIATSATHPGEQCAEALEQATRLGVQPERVAVEPAWSPGALDLGRLRALGRPILCTTDDPVTAVLAWERGARFFRTTAGQTIGDALARARALGA